VVHQNDGHIRIVANNPSMDYKKSKSSVIEIGTPSLISVGFYYVYHEIIQHTIIGIQVVSFQISVHAAIDNGVNIKEA
jgi:hypothetical protein